MSEERLNEIIENINKNNTLRTCIGAMTPYDYEIAELLHYFLDLKQALNEIREYIKSWAVYECDKNTVRELSFESSKEDILQIIDKVLGSDK